MTESWVFGANDPLLGRGLNHLPYTAYTSARGERHLAVGIGACLLDLHLAAPVLPQQLRDALSQPTLNSFMALGPAAWQSLRTTLQHLLSRDHRERALLEAALLPVRDLPLCIPCSIPNYTDFYASRHHALRVGQLFRPDKPLLDNYDWIPIAYHGRSSSLVPSGTPIRRPHGQIRVEPSARPVFVPSQRLDFELELAFFIGPGNALGEPIAIADAPGHIFGLALLNDWSARDIQAWEYQPLGPFLGKNFATSLSPWITPMAALEGCRRAAPAHPGGLLEYLDDSADQTNGALNLELTIELRPGTPGGDSFLIHSNPSALWWTAAQMVAHHTASGCNLQPGDLLASGTVSGPDREESGCLLELTANGAAPLTLSSGERRTFLQDGDEVVLSGWARPHRQLPIQLGECRGQLLSAKPHAYGQRSSSSELG